jgi:fatty acid desaturase
MAISDIKKFAHLTEADIEAIGEEFDALRREIESSLGARDAQYIYNTIRFQRSLELAGRIVLLGSRTPVLWWLGAVSLGVAKIVENMEIGHNVMHGQWDWMNDPEVHSSQWEWDNTSPAAHWKHQHNYLHHKYTNIVGLDEDVGYGVVRVTRDEPWKPSHLGNLLWNALLASLFEVGVAVQHISPSAAANMEAKPRGWHTSAEGREKIAEVAKKIAKQIGKDYVLFPALTGPAFKSTLRANFAANLIRNFWSNAVIFCGHFPDGAEKFTTAEVENETQGQWYLRQMLGSANFTAGPLMRFMSGNLCHQIEHHLYPDLPSNRLSAISKRVREICAKYDLPYTTGSFPKQYFLTWRTIAKLSLPNRFLSATSDNAPETSSELRFRGLDEPARSATGGRLGLNTAYGMTRPAWQKRIIRTVRRLPGLAPAHPVLAR